MVDYKCSIIANPKGDAWDFACGVYKYLEEKVKQEPRKKSSEFNKKITEFLKETRGEEDTLGLKELLCKEYEFHTQENGDKLELNSMNVKEFPDGESLPKIENNVRRTNCFFIHDSNLNPDRWLTMLWFVNNALRTSSPHEIINVLPYLKFSRQDRKSESRVPISAKVLADSLNYDHTRVLTIDVHNESIQGFYSIPFDSLPPYPILFDFFKKNYPEDYANLAILGTDEGTKKRMARYAEKRGLEVALVDKYRKISGEFGESLGVLGADKIQGKVVLIPDDIIASGKTLINAARAARNSGAKKVITYGTHAMYTSGYEEVMKYIDLSIIGDTIKQPYKPQFNVPKDKLITLSFIPLIGEAIYRISKGESLSELFD